jgi:hypothetical protein
MHHSFQCNNRLAAMGCATPGTPSFRINENNSAATRHKAQCLGGLEQNLLMKAGK